MKVFLSIFVGSLIGWTTNYIAIKMLFRPHKEINLGLFKIQGLIPKRKAQIGESVANVIEAELISIRDIVSKLNKNEFSERLENIVDEILEKDLKNKIKTALPILEMFLSDSLVETIKKNIKSIILENKEEVIKFFTVYIEDNIKFKDIIYKKISNFSLEKIEEIIFSLARKELKHIEIIGAILGGTIGFLQYIILIYLV